MCAFVCVCVCACVPLGDSSPLLGAYWEVIICLMGLTGRKRTYPSHTKTNFAIAQFYGQWLHILAHAEDLRICLIRFKEHNRTNFTTF